MVSVDSNTLVWIALFAAIGIISMVPKIYKATTTFWQAVWFLSETRKYKGDMGKAFRMLPRLMVSRFKYGKAAENIKPHLVYHFVSGGRTENKITQDISWLEHIADWLSKTTKGSTLQMTLGDIELNTQSIMHMKRSTLALSDGMHAALIIEDFNNDPLITEQLAHDFWPFLATLKFYAPEINYVLVKNCPTAISYISTSPCEIREVGGIEYTIFATSQSIVETILGQNTVQP